MSSDIGVFLLLSAAVLMLSDGVLEGVAFVVLWLIAYCGLSILF